MLALKPKTVDLSLLPEKGQKLIGVGGKMAPQDANADFGWETLEAAAEIAVKEVRHRLENSILYRGHGNSLLEGLWRQSKA